MSPSFKLIEHIKLINTTSTNWCCFQSEDNRVAILSLAGVYIFEIANVKDNTILTTSYRKKMIQLCKYIPTANLGIDVLNILRKLSKNDIYETVLRTDMTPQFDCGNIVLTASTFVPIFCSWSSQEMIENKQCVIAILSQYGAVSIYRKRIDTSNVSYIDICNVSKFIIDMYTPSWQLKPTATPIETLEEYKFRISKVTITAVTWSNQITIEDENFAILITAISNGCILFFKVPQLKMDDFSDINLTFLGEYSDNFQQISHLHWVNTTSKTNGLLYFGTFAGTISCVPVLDISTNKVELSKQMDYISISDNITITKILHSYFNDNFYLFVTKGNHFIVILSNNEGTVLDIQCLRVGTLQICGLNLVEENTILLITQVGIMKELRIKESNNKLDIDWKYIYIDMNWRKKRCNGWFLSKNQVQYGFITTPARLTESKDLQYDMVSIYLDKDKNVLKLLKDNCDSLRNYWDCLETIRICSLLDKKDFFIDATFEKDYSKMNLLQLKLNYWLSTFFQYIKHNTEYTDANNLKSPQDIACIININIAINYIRKVLETDWKTLSDFQKQSIVSPWLFLKEVIADDILTKLGISDTYTSISCQVLMELQSLDLPQPLDCLYCGEKLISSSCLEKHHDCRCGMSQMQILQAKYICTICKCSFHEEVRKEFPIMFCPYCDMPIEFVIDIKREIKLTGSTNLDDKPKISDENDSTNLGDKPKIGDENDSTNLGDTPKISDENDSTNLDDKPKICDL